jgi:predicted transcriptional regulator of viral defense system
MTLAGRIREAAKELEQFSRRDISDAIEVMSYKERDEVSKAFQDFIRRGEFERIGDNLYHYVRRKDVQTYRQRFWDIARRMIRFTVSDLEQITQARRNTILEFCSWMVKKGYAQRLKKGHFKVIGRLKPTVPTYNKYKESSEGRDQR